MLYCVSSAAALSTWLMLACADQSLYVVGTLIMISANGWSRRKPIFLCLKEWVVPYIPTFTHHLHVRFWSWPWLRTAGLLPSSVVTCTAWYLSTSVRVKCWLVYLQGDVPFFRRTTLYWRSLCEVCIPALPAEFVFLLYVLWYFLMIIAGYHITNNSLCL